MPLKKIYPNYDTDNISESEAVKNFALFSMIFEVPQFLLARGDNQWVPRFLLLIGDTIRLSHDFLPHQKRSSWWKILHQTCVALQLSLSRAPCHIQLTLAVILLILCDSIKKHHFSSCMKIW